MRKMIVSGRIGANAEVKMTKTGSQVIEFRIANNERRDEEGQTYWFRVSSFNPSLVNFAQFLTKGKTVEVIGTLTTRGYVNTTTNKIEVGHDILADAIMFDGNFGRSLEEGTKEGTNTTYKPTSTPVTASEKPAKKATLKPTTAPIPTPKAAPAEDDGADDLPF